MTDELDILIRDSIIVDGTGKPAFRGNIGIRTGIVAAVGDVKGDATREIDATGLIAAPGFIDPHSHGDATILRYPLAENLVMQGITTILAGQCGHSAAPTSRLSFGEFLTQVERAGPSLNFASLVGFGAIRETVMGSDFKRKAKPTEIEGMKRHVEEAMRSGAFGISSSLDPGIQEYAGIGEYPPTEVVECVRVAGKYGGMYQPHTRHNQTQWYSDDPNEMTYGIFHGPIEDVWVGRYRGYSEAIETSRRANGIRLHIAHLHSAYPIYQPHPDFLAEACAKATLTEIVDKARSEGLDVTFNAVVPDSGIARATPLINEFPGRNDALKWLKGLQREQLVTKLRMRDTRDQIRKVYDAGRLKLGMVHTKQDPYWFNCFKIVKFRNKEYLSKTVGEIAQQRGTDALETLFDLIVEDPETMWFQHIDKRHNKINQILLAHPQGSPCTDVGIYPAKPEPGPEGLPNNIAYGVYAFYVGTYVREKAILSLEEAVRKATQLPALIIGLENRGVLTQGSYADMVVFNLDTINMNTDPMNPATPPTGIEYVLVNGEIVYERERHTGERSGKVIRHRTGMRL